MSQNPSRLEINTINGVGSARSEKFNRLNIETIEDLLYYFPKRYENRRNKYSIAEAEPGENVLIQAKVRTKKIIKPKPELNILKVKFSDHTGNINCIWFNQNYLINKFEQGQEFMIFGRINKENWKEFGRKEINNPILEAADKDELLHTGRIVPIYSLTEDLSQKFLRKVVYKAVKNYQKYFREWLPDEIIERYNLPRLNGALAEFHFPTTRQKFREAKLRLAFEELFILQLKLLQNKNFYSKSVGKAQAPDPELISLLSEQLDFDLTSAQKQAWHEIAGDLENAAPMHRLLQGDVGAGKTIVALLALLTAAANDNLGIFMAPTEILAEQHYYSFQELLSKLPVNIDLLTGSKNSIQREAILNDLHNGITDILIGTHSLLENDFYSGLGLAVIDEQHKFGVRQRREILNKGVNPDLLVMTATPIPRSLALTLYGDMDISTIEELPSGRPPVITKWRNKEDSPGIYRFVKERIQKGEKAYVVCPLIEPTKKEPELSAVKTRAKFLAAEYFSTQEVEVLHGNLNPDKKQKIMENFRQGNIKVLVSTTVIEVGLDIPDATFMIIENAEQFGLAQLHQLRGRVSRGSKRSFCVLIADPTTEEASRRLKTMVKIDDGFKIAERDLEIRGPGKIFGDEQHGLSDFKVADLTRHEKLLKVARKEAKVLLQNSEWERKNPALADKISELEIVL